MQALQNNFGAPLLPERTYRENVVRKALNITRDTVYEPSDYERNLLTKFVEGTLTIEEVITLLEDNI
jgi:hypothetical protein